MQEIGRAEIVIRLYVQRRGKERLGQDAEPDAGASGERLAVGAYIEHTLAVTVEREGRFHVLSLKPQLPIGGIFEQVNGMSRRALVFPQQFERGRFLGEAGRHAGRILIVADQIEQLYAAQASAAFQSFEHFLKPGQV